MTNDPDRLDDLRRLQSRLERERRARVQAERLLETKALELYEANRALGALAAELEQRVEARTRELSLERQRALRLAEVDALTGINNRASFNAWLDTAMGDPQARADGLAVLLIDLDGFKTVNDTFGHGGGDAMLVEFARRLRDAVRPGDFVARLGGDEFAVVARGVGHQDGAWQMSQRLLRVVVEPMILDARAVPCDCSIGVAMAGTGSATADEVLRDADLALYASKRAGRARVTRFEESLREQLNQRAMHEAEVRRAVEDNGIEPWFQPIVACDGRHFVGAEVLARWHLPGGEVRAPGAFLDAVEALGLLDLMMENVLRRALPEARPLVDAGRLGYLSINVSPTQFNQGWAQRRLPQLLDELDFAPTGVLVEITETALLRDPKHTRATLAALTGQGIRIALDDFGVGYSNFAMLRHLSTDVLKLDRTLICDIETDDEARALAECVMQLASRLRIKVVAEGVETAQQAELLTAAGCTAMQGYFFARPQRHLATWFAADAP